LIRRLIEDARMKALNAVRPGPGRYRDRAETLDALRAEKAALCHEIRNYPQPIAGCDVQFNWLCEQRDALAGRIAILAADC
jgi:hypothetical protein